MTFAPATEAESGAKRRIGDILLELGFVGEEALAKAAEEQEKSGQPLGQILVEHGAITRLELASALAEQWSDQVSISPLPAPTAPPRAVPQQPRHHDEDRYAARLQEAVADLTQRVRMPDTENPLDSRLVELAERVEATVARTQRLEATVATLVENLEGMTSGVEEAFSVLQSGMSGLAMDLARMETTIVDLAARTAEPAADPALTARIDDLWKLVHELSDRPLVDADARERADELAARLEVLADRASLEQVEGSLDGLRSSLDDLGDLRAAVAELETRPAGSPELDARLERLEARLNEYGAAAADTTAVESLTGRLDAALATQSALEASLGAIDERLELLAQDLASRADASLAEHVATVEGRLGGLVSGEDLSLALERTREELASMPPESDPRIDELARELTSVRDELHEATAARLDAVEARLQAELAVFAPIPRPRRRSPPSPSGSRSSPAIATTRKSSPYGWTRSSRACPPTLSAPGSSRPPSSAPARSSPRSRRSLDPRVDDLARELASVRDELHQEEAASRLEAIEARLEAGLASSTDPEAAKALAALSERIEELSRDRHAHDELTARLDALDGRLAGAVTGEELASAIERTREELAPAPPEPDPRIEKTAARLETIEARLEAGLASSTDPEAAQALASLSERIEELSRERHAQEALAAKLAALESRLPTDTVTAGDLAAAVEELRAEQATAIVDTGLEVDPGLEVHCARAMRSREADRAARSPRRAAGTCRRARGAAALLPSSARSSVASSTRALRPSRALSRRGSPRRGRAAGRGARTPRGPRGGHRALPDDARAPQHEPRRARPHPLGDALRTRRHPAPRRARRTGRLARGRRRCLAGRRRPHRREPGFSRDLEPNEMRQLIRRIEDCEEAAHEGREKLMNRLERMASSIDWRLQRLEADEPSE